MGQAAPFSEWIDDPSWAARRNCWSAFWERPRWARLLRFIHLTRLTKQRRTLAKPLQGGEAQ